MLIFAELIRIIGDGGNQLNGSYTHETDYYPVAGHPFQQTIDEYTDLML